MNTFVNSMEEHVKRVMEQVEVHKAEVLVIQKLSKEASQQLGDCVQRKVWMERREHFISDYVDVVRESEDLCRRQYTKSIYAATVCKEVAKCALSALEVSLTMLESLRAMKCKSVTDVMANTSYL